MSRVDYYEYLASDEWKRKREVIIERDNHECQFCLSSNGLEVHHKTYARLGHERGNDLITLCHRCHIGVHKAIRATEEVVAPRPLSIPLVFIPDTVKSSVKILPIWNEILGSIKIQSIPTECLLKSCRVASFDDSTILLYWSTDNLKTRFEVGRHRNLLERTLESIMDKRISVKSVVA